ncbi:hypothetical protein [Pseudoteredinibacter isoporae]|uniref:hypothetical protein n=1 Tax=Pseudoteredinibacter isoporae TaxID=570281 RepID=UPI0031024119
MKIYYINTDLELESPEDLTPIVNEFGESVFNLYNGEGRGHYLATFESNHNSGSPDAVIQFLCGLVESFEPEERRLWDQCYSRIFDIGYEGGTHRQSYTDEIRPETLSKIAALNASIRITVYPMDTDSSET